MEFKRWAVVLICSLAIVITVTDFLGAQEKDDRIGFAEEFDSVEGWKVTSGGAAKTMKSENGIAVFDTYIGGFKRIKLPNQPSVSGRIYVNKTYEQEVDFDKYHYIVMNIVQKNMLTILYVNSVDGRKQTHVAASTGVAAQDITPLGLKGRQKVSFAFKIMNTGGVCKVDYIRFVSRLTDEEKKGLIAPPLKLYKEGIKRHPYQKLEALWQRAPRPWPSLPKNYEERALFRDVGTGMPVWRHTASPAHEGLKGRTKPYVWRPDGSSISAGWRTYFFAEDKWKNKGGRSYTPRDYVPPKEKKEPVYEIVDDKANKKIIFKRLKPKQEEAEIIYEHPYPAKPYYYRAMIRISGNRLIAVFRGAEAVLVCPEEKDEKKKVRVTQMLPIQSDKGSGISGDGRYFRRLTPFGSYHNSIVDMVEQKVFPGALFTQTHGMVGKPWRIMTYGGTGKVLIHNNAFAPGNYTPGKDIRVYGVWNDRLSTDYGEMTKDCRYGITNGTKGELGGQYLLFDRLDAGTILRLCTYNVSYATYDLRAKVSTSLDYTKLAYASDMLGTADFYITIIRRPDTPVEVKAEQAGSGVKLSWSAPINYREIKGYNVYRSEKSGLGYKRINKEFVTGTEFTDAEAPAGKAVFYLVATEEHSGLMSVFSPEVSVSLQNEPIILHYEAESQEKARPVRDVVDGYASGYRAVRLTKLAADEDVGTFTISTNLPRKGNYAVWGLCRGYREENKGKFTLKLGGKSVGELPVEKGEWVWVKSRLKVSLEPDSKLVVTSADDSIMVDKIIITDDEKYTPRTVDDRKAAPAPVKGLKVANTTADSVELAWEASPDPDIYCYSVYCSEKANFTPGNETLVCSRAGKRASVTDWGLKLGTKYYYKVVAIDKLGNESKPAVAGVDTPKIEPVTVEVPLGNASPSEGLQKATHAGAECYKYPNVEAGKQTLKYDFEIPADGEYYVWLQYIPTYNVKIEYGEGLGVMVDGKNVGSMSIPGFAPPRRSRDKRWFYGRLKNRAKLLKGKHSLTIVFEEAKGRDRSRTRRGQLVSKLWVTNDVSYVPAGYSPQIMFSKMAKWERK